MHRSKMTWTKSAEMKQVSEREDSHVNSKTCKHNPMFTIILFPDKVKFPLRLIYSIKGLEHVGEIHSNGNTKRHAQRVPSPFTMTTNVPTLHVCISISGKNKWWMPLTSPRTWPGYFNIQATQPYKH